jgi:predicted dehydrogenase
VEPRALVIGCGNIGALYDLDTDEVRTHAKAYRTRGVPFDVLDVDPARARRVAERYQTEAFADLAAVDLSRYQAVSLCSDTGTHAAYLRRLLSANVPLIFCEKPVAAALADLTELRSLHDRSRSVVVVNYMRRFLAPYGRLRDRIRGWAAETRLQSLVVRYHRGFLNNAGHALDLIEFLFDRTVDLARFSVLQSTADAFPSDPTLTASFDFAGAPALLLGFPGSRYAIFDLELNFEDRRVHIAEMGDRILFYSKAPGTERALRLDEELSENGCLRDYMLPVFDAGFRLLGDQERGDTNFDGASALNVRMVAATLPGPPRGSS